MINRAITTDIVEFGLPTDVAHTDLGKDGRLKKSVPVVDTRDTQNAVEETPVVSVVEDVQVKEQPQEPVESPVVEVSKPEEQMPDVKQSETFTDESPTSIETPEKKRGRKSKDAVTLY